MEMVKSPPRRCWQTCWYRRTRWCCQTRSCRQAPPAPELGCAPMDLILCIASNLRCLIARSSSILFSLLVLNCELSGSAKPGGIVAEGGTFEEASFSELAIEGPLEASPHALLLFLSRPMPSLVRLMLSRAYPARLSAERVVVRPLHSVFGSSKPLLKE
jgi:hypothetical protein